MGGRRSGKPANLAKTVRQRELSRVRGRFSFFRSQLLYRVYAVVPPRYRWLLPMLRDYLPSVAADEVVRIACGGGDAAVTVETVSADATAGSAA